MTADTRANAPVYCMRRHCQRPGARVYVHPGTLTSPRTVARLCDDCAAALVRMGMDWKAEA